MVALRGHFDGKVIVPDVPVDLPRDQTLIVHVELWSSRKSRLREVRVLRGSWRTPLMIRRCLSMARGR